MTAQAASYIRVSSEEQRKRNTEEAQRLAISKYAKKNSYVIVKEYADLGVSGMLKDRPALDDLRMDVINGTVRDIIIYDIDRLSRDKDLYGGLKHELTKEYGAKIHYVEGTDTGDDTIDSTMEMLKALMADSERVKMLARMRAGKLARSEHGAVYVSTAVPYGYDYIPKSKGGPNIVINDEESEIVKIIFDLFCSGTSLRQLELYLNQQGYKAKKGGRWHRTVLNRILASETYIGNFYFGKEKSKMVWITDDDGNRKKIERGIQRPRDEWVKVPVPAIIKEEQFKQAQILLKQNQKFNRRNTKRIYPYAHLIKCGLCGRNFNSTHTVNQYGVEYRHYKCSSRNSSAKFYDPCGNINYSEKLLNKLIWGHVFSKKLDLDTDWLVNKMSEVDGEDIEEVEKETKRRVNVQKKILKRLEKEEDRLLQVFKKGLFDEDKIQEELNSVVKQKKDAEEAIETAQKKYREVNKSYFTRLVESDWDTKIEDLEGYMTKNKVPPPAELKVILRQSINEITAYPDKIVIDGEIKIPLEDDGNNSHLSSPKGFSG